VAREEYATAYALTWIICQDQTDAQLFLGSDDQAKIWLNGELQHTVTSPRPFSLDEDTMPVALSKGRNVVLVKVCNETRYWQFSLRVLGSDGEALEGVKFMRPEP
jgi:hypothetical protein